MRRFISFFIVAVILTGSLGVMAGPVSDAAANDMRTTPASDDPSMNGGTPVAERFSELDEAHVLLVQDLASFWGNSNQLVLDLLAPDVTYDIMNSGSLAGADLSDYTFVIIEGNQPASFNTNVLNAMTVLQDYVDGGGWLQFHMGTNTHSPQLMLWDGTTYVYQDNDLQNWVGPDGDGHPILEGLSEPFPGNAANHGYLLSFPVEAAVIVMTTSGNPTVIEYEYGQGNVMVSTMTLEYLWTYYNATSGQILYNMMVYMADRPPSGPVQIEIIPDNPPVVVPQGGSMGYSAHITSVYPQTVDAVAWISMEFPNGQIFEPLRQAPITITNGMDLYVTNLTQVIPLIAPLGVYQYHLSLGMNLGHPLLEDHFNFTVIAAGHQAGGNITWDVMGFDRLSNTASTGESNAVSMPVRFGMAEVYPNPFNPTANISIALPEATELNVTVFNVMGQQVATLAQGRFSTGTHQFVFDGSNLSSGIYFVHAATGNGDSALQRAVLMK